MKKTLTIPAVLILCLMFLLHCGGNSLRISVEDSSGNSFENSSAGSSDSSGDGISQGTFDDSSGATSKAGRKKDNKDREKLSAIFDELASASGERPNMALLGRKYGLSQAEVFAAVSKLTAEGKIDTEDSLKSNKKARAALALIEAELSSQGGANPKQKK